ncbi:1-acyl-sn-glycerol-3-phosphate acyltransferase [Candidatus Woesearchaeota archaeon]|jgi:1-acyl-sn-glycerol-3-phosphate acyltransferase|nr:1-acyl-sn-glycerol-3-phosphate acyltransferase [Candidatus Woesearchaeota archaeon]MBT4835453.1 1-acyl-sn-glycerol-3-phosphate acyltransferase [Candidatus Woesearchaeota archaeon]MBT6734855.1 1-acyl-sn-glycerol-3-phosphate acyltransferase [Candidatus Woesearchaeota archaeon]MBT7169630.1 1-acyl-sn-glycerol-3-phosphate acyltransferase [Candidatus Woesearchaeota archaeon]MBT7474588.1 1-acyl-sn-glycerol-3-phosphate acyltransferase [Candidatus Woesearchaeota archaeon]
MKSSKVYKNICNLSNKYINHHVDINVFGQENLENIDGGIVAINHSGAGERSKDHLLVCSAFGIDIPLHFFVYSGIYRNPALRFVLNQTKQIPVNPGSFASKINKECFKLAKEYLSRDDCVAIFPEGMSSNILKRKQNGKKYYPGLGKLVIDSPTKPIIPVRVDVNSIDGGNFIIPDYNKASVSIGEPYYFFKDMKNIEKYLFNEPGRKEMIEISKHIMEEKVHTLESLI